MYWKKDKNMTLELGTRKILLSAGLRDTCGTINEALAKGAVDAVVWIRDLHGAADDCEAMSKLGLRVAPAAAAAIPHSIAVARNDGLLDYPINLYSRWH
jgi:hypothetical protein